jgi:hypothetical protein
MKQKSPVFSIGWFCYKILEFCKYDAITFKRPGMAALLHSGNDKVVKIRDGDPNIKWIIYR